MFQINDTMVSKRTGNRGRIIRYRDGQFLCEMAAVYDIEGKRNDGCRFWFRAADMLTLSEAANMHFTGEPQ